MTTVWVAVVCPVVYRFVTDAVPRGPCTTSTMDIILGGREGPLVVDYRVWPDAVPPEEFNVGVAIQGVFIPQDFLSGACTDVGTVGLVIAELADAGLAMGEESTEGSLSQGTAVWLLDPVR